MVMKMDFKELFIPGSYEIIADSFQDNRGSFVKVFNETIFEHEDIKLDMKEQYYSVSHKGVLRGLHFQIPPFDHSKLVYCLMGSVMDVIVDLRIGSPTFGKYCKVELSSNNKKVMFIPSGLAHGFYVLSEQAILVYSVTSEYSEKHDGGILWNSLDIPWPTSNPIISQRDSQFCELDLFVSPFTYKGRTTG